MRYAFFGEVGEPESGFTAARLAAEMRWHEGPFACDVFSFGGSLWEALAMRSLVMGYAGDTECRVVGIAASAASVFVTGFKKRTMFASAYLMIHEAEMVMAGRASDMEATAERIEKLNDMVAQAYADSTGGKTDAAAFRAMMKAETYLTAAEALALGLVDEVVEEPVQADGHTNVTNYLGYQPGEAKVMRIAASIGMVEKNLSVPLDVRSKLLKLSASITQTNPTGTNMQELLLALGLTADTKMEAAVAKAKEVIQNSARLASMQEQLELKSNLVTTMKAELDGLKNKLSEAEGKLATQAVASTRMTLCQEAGVTMSDENAKALERRIATMNSLADEAARKDMLDDIKMWVKANGVKAGASGMEKPTGRENPGAEGDTYEAKLQKVMNRLRKSDPKMSLDDALKAATAELAKADPAGDDE